MAGDGRIVIDVILDDGSVAKGVADLDGKVGKLGGTGERASLGIGKIVTALGLVALASKGIDMVKQSLDGAINRYDTLNQFPRVMQQMGFDAASTEGAINKLSNGIDGLPTALDDIASKTQRIAVMTGDLDGAVNTTLALNNAFLASGASTADAERGLDQYVQMLAKGEVDLQSWRTLQETMGLSLNEVAKSFGFAGKSAQNDLYVALREGDITFDEFNDKMIEMSNKTGGFADIAKESSGGIKTSWANMKTAIVKGLADVITAIDEALGGVGSIAGYLDTAKGLIKQAFLAISESIPAVVEGLKSVYNVIEPWIPLIAGVVVAFLTFQTIISVMAGVSAAITAVKAAMVALNASMLANPFALVIAVIAGLATAFVLAYQKIEWFRDAVDTVWSAIRDQVMEKFEKIKHTITSLVQSAVELAKAKLEDLKAFWSANGESILNKAKTTFNNIKTTISNIVKDVVSFVKTQLDKFKAFWDENGATIMALVKMYFTNVMTQIKMVMGIIKGIFEVAWPIITGVVKIAWSLIKTIVSTAIDIVLGVIRTVMRLIEGDWKGAWESVKKIVKDVWENIKTFFSEVDLVQVGKDIIAGLITGLSSMIGSVATAAKEIASTVKDTVTGFFKVKSPSRVMMEIGGFLAQGLEKGMQSRKIQLAAAARDMSLVVKDVMDHYKSEERKIIKTSNAEIAKIEKRAKEDVAKIYRTLGKKKKQLTKDDTVRIQRIQQDAAKKTADLEKKAMSDSVKLLSEAQKEKLKEVKLFIDDKKSMEQLSLVEEAALWEKAIKLFDENTKERVEAQKNYKNAVEAVNKEITSINQEYSDKMQKINDDLAKSEQQLNDEYNKAYSDRISAITGFANTFDEFVVKFEGTGQTLLDNLQSQVTGLQDWREVLDSLWGKIDDQALMEELEGMGPKALGELQALNSLSKDELSRYVTLYNEKFRLARDQASSELSGMKEDTESRINEMREAANKELSTLEKEWVEGILSVTKATDRELKSLKQIGVDAGKGLDQGLASMKPQLIKTATDMANAVKAALAAAFDIHSPSRWMRDMIGKNMMLGWMQGIDGEKSATLKKAREAIGWMKPDVPTGFVNKLRGVTIPNVNVTPFNSALGGGNGRNTTYSDSKSYNPTFHNHFTKDESSPSEVARKNKQQSQRQAMEMGFS